MVIVVEATGLTLTLVTGREIAGIANENAKLFEQAEQSVKMRDEFLSVASHDLKTPLTSLNLELQRIRMEAEKLEISEHSSRLLSLSGHTLNSTKRTPSRGCSIRLESAK